jgi:hypothetical protein
MRGTCHSWNSCSQLLDVCLPSQLAAWLARLMTRWWTYHQCMHILLLSILHNCQYFLNLLLYFQTRTTSPHSLPLLGRGLVQRSLRATAGYLEVFLQFIAVWLSYLSWSDIFLLSWIAGVRSWVQCCSSQSLSVCWVVATCWQHWKHHLYQSVWLPALHPGWIGTLSLACPLLFGSSW